MAKKITEQQLKQMIGYWIEVRHINCAIENLVEDTDEIGELYEYSLWTKMTRMVRIHLLWMSMYYWKQLQIEAMMYYE